ncbi:MAG: DEAD/DEAH box helicase [Chthoniobacteraceae bacterium]
MPTTPAGKTPFFDWFRARYGKPTPAQRAAWPRIRRGENVLLASPTGTGKTFAAFLAVLDSLAAMHARGALPTAIQCVYVSPLRALSYDLEKNLNGPLREVFGEHPPIRVELRTGDTSAAHRTRQFTKPPHILLTTPESLCVLLSQEKWLPILAGVRWLIVDEIHALAENKRGAHLALGIERLADLRRTSGHPERKAASRNERHAVEGPGSNTEPLPFITMLRSKRTAQEHPATLEPGPPTARRITVAHRRSAQDDSSARPLIRIGLSATIAPLSEVARFLVGSDGQCVILDVSAKKRVELSVHTPLRRNPYPEAGFTGIRMMRDLGEQIKKHRTTLVFCNTRSGAESISFWLREKFPDLADQIECHHASLEREVRLAVEDRLKRGELRAVVCSTSLELGIDIGSVELVVMMSTPKGVSKALQRAGRAGHNIHSVSRGLLMATNVGDLVESCATVLLARRRHLDEVRLPRNPLDVLAQHLVSMGCTQRWTRTEAFALVRRAAPFSTLSVDEFDAVLDYLAGGGASLRRQYTEVFGKIELDDEGFATRPGRVQRDFLQNIGVIPNVGQVRVRTATHAIGSVEESFMSMLSVGDIFVLAGRAVRLDKVSNMEAWVTRCDGSTPTVPRWNASKFPLSNRVAQEIVAFRRELRERLPASHPERSGASRSESREVEGPGSNAKTPAAKEIRAAKPSSADAARKARSGSKSARLRSEASNQPRAGDLAPEPSTPLRSAQDDLERWIAGRLDCGIANARILYQAHFAQAQVSEIPTDDCLLVEEFIERDGKSNQPRARHYIFHSLIGRNANDALSRAIVVRLNELPGGGGNALATPHDYGFILTVAFRQSFTEADIPALLRLEGFDHALSESLRQSEMLKYHFRNAAQTGLMVYRNYFGQAKSVRKLAWSAEVIFNVLQQHEPDHVLLREAMRDSLHTYLDAEGARAFLEAQQSRPVRLLRVDKIPPLSFAMLATKMREAVMVEDPFEMQERLYHQWWNDLTVTDTASISKPIPAR